jgi:3-methylfumaryl-CoA hydratase
MADLKDWIGKSERRTDPMSPWPAAALIATLELDRPAPGPGDPLPPFWHWMHFLEAAPRSALGPDGHPATGGFIPAVPQPRRMWAGGRLIFHAPLPLGDEAERVSTIADVEEKTGRTGSLSFVTVSHEIRSGGTLAVTESQDIVYREDFDPSAPKHAPKPAPGGESHARDWSCDPTVLFRYSALTFNGHRIHYDLEHARRTEGYPGLVVHGPLLATLLLELAREMGLSPEAFAFCAVAPVFAGERFTCCGLEGDRGLDLWVRGPDGRLAMTAEAS